MLNRNYLLPLVLAFVCMSQVQAKKVDRIDHDKMLMDHGDGHMMDMAGGMVMGQNTDHLPGSCDEISEEKEITVRAGHKYSKPFPGRMYAFDQQEYHFKPCTRLTVHFINEDSVRHQWMMHGLPKYLYPKGMFHLEATGPSKISGTLILPAEDKTYLIHCDLAQHMEKGMKGQLIVGKGSQALSSIPGVTPLAITDSYVVGQAEEEAAAAAATAAASQSVATTSTNKSTGMKDRADSWLSGITILGLAAGLLLAPLLSKRFKGMSVGEVIADVAQLLTGFIKAVVTFASSLLHKAGKKKESVDESS